MSSPGRYRVRVLCAVPRGDGHRTPHHAYRRHLHSRRGPPSSMTTRRRRSRRRIALATPLDELIFEEFAGMRLRISFPLSGDCVWARHDSSARWPSGRLASGYRPSVSAVSAGGFTAARLRCWPRRKAAASAGRAGAWPSAARCRPGTRHGRSSLDRAADELRRAPRHARSSRRHGTLKAISDPASSSYGHWLTNAEFDARYAPAGPPSPRCRTGSARKDSRSPRPCTAGCTWRPAVRSPRWRAPSAPACTTTPTSVKDVHANNSQLSLPA